MVQATPNMVFQLIGFGLGYWISLSTILHGKYKMYNYYFYAYEENRVVPLKAILVELRRHGA